jgi:hypothetical protein
MVSQIPPNGRIVDDGFYSKSRQIPVIPDAGEKKDLRGPNRAGGQYHFFLGGDDSSRT